MKFELTWKSFVAETPRVARRFGTSFLAVGTMAASISYVVEHETIALVFAIFAAVGKFLTSFFSEDALATAATPVAPSVPEAPVQEPPK